MCQKTLKVTPVLKARIKALSARRDMPMTALLSELVRNAEEPRAVRQGHETARRIAVAAMRADPSPSMLRDVVAVFGDQLMA